ncbi:hypothetical protein XENTR_v10007104 [Xenopus tropicalis]|uniref:Mastermind-like protein 2 n=1 Tax=Xenopus tropicalis TaxID=8364 RepID=F7C5X6_XENTR|nr:mastermind-like protein 2 [Xenopus tropicalis]XP_031753186.1 mastermind-like protein 2 [Xenopus tropicalis]KAE8627686.1 hypothetical protein XENTR_v10007104 [Xenopus tropicalis]KAE8627687.1 hypothetical protein XENTR_v10007104 [Xenopus tropicalis]
MGETAPPQAPAGNLGIGVAGAGLLGGGSVTPRIHSAIVERLRARIAVCRQHHLNCEGRYERSRAESSDRERENTLHLLTLVQHGQGTRKNNKHNKSTCAPPPDYHHHHQQHLQSTEGKEINGNQQPQSSNGLNQRNSALIALQGSLKRRIVPPAQSKRPNGISDHSFLDFKKLKNEHLLAAQSRYHNVDGMKLASSGDRQMELAGPRSTDNTNNNSNCNVNDLFSFALKDIKKEPGEAVSCGKHLDVPLSHENQLKYEEDSGEQFMDPDLQELFNELTYISVPPMSDTELQNMINITIKQDEPFHIDIGHQNQRTTSSSMPLDKVTIKSEYSPGLDPARVASPQLRPSSTGPAFPMSSAPLTSTPNATAPHNPSQTQVSGTNRLHSWQELSHAQQLKQIAANRQNNIIHQHQPSQPSSWPTMSPTGLSPRPFGDVKVPSPFRHQQLSPHSPSTSAVPVNGAQSKMMSSYLYKQNASSQNNSNELIKAQDAAKCAVTNSTQEQIHSNIKPLFHFNQDQPNQQISSAVSNPNKPVLQFPQQKQQTPTSKQHHEQTQQVQSVSNQQLSRPTTFQQKMTFPKLPQNQPISGLHYSSVHSQQDQHSATAPGTPTSSNPASCASPNTGNGYSSQQPLSAQQLMEKANALQRQMMEQKQQLLLQQQMLAGMEKSNSQDQMSHLNRPPPDYKDQRRSSVGLQQPASHYSNGLPTVGVNQSPPATTNPVPTHNLTPPNPSHSSPNHSSRMTPLPGAQNMYGTAPCSQQAMYNASPGASKMQQQTSPNTLGSNQNSHILPRQSPSGQGNPLPPFSAGSATSPPQFRPSLNHGTNMAGQRPSNGLINSPVPQIWASQEAKKQSGLCFSNTNQFSNQSLQGMLGSQNFAPNQPELQMRAQMSQSPAGQTMEPLRGFNSGQAQLRAQLSPNPNQGGASTAMAANTFTSTNQVPRAFPGSDTNNDLGSFDFLSTNSDFDFIDTLLKTGHANDDWIKDIILDEIFKNHA